MTNLNTFNYLSSSVRVIEIDDQLWFVAADVCRILDLEHVSNALKPLADDQKTRKQITGMRGPAALLISESGLYKLVMRSDKPEARQFQDWVSREALSRHVDPSQVRNVMKRDVRDPMT